MYRKFTADHLFTGTEILSKEKVLITDEAGYIVDIMERDNAGDGIIHQAGLLSPGFVNAHCHIELSHLKGVIPERTGLVDFVQLVMRQRDQAGLNQNELAASKQAAMNKAVQELYDGGTVAVGDICNTADTIPIKSTHNLAWYNFIEVSGFVDATAGKRLNDSLAIMEIFKEQLPWCESAIVPHAPYSVSKKLFEGINDISANRRITIHNQESEAENEWYIRKEGSLSNLYSNFGIDTSGFSATGKSSIQSCLPYLNRAESLILVHNTFTSEDDLFWLNNVSVDKGELFFCLCINANLYIEDRVPPIDLLRKHTAKIVVGTDSYASNHQLNILEELKTIDRVMGKKIGLTELLQWSTINGADALGLAHELGSFTKGKRPGIVLIEGLDELSFTPQSKARRIL